MVVDAGTVLKRNADALADELLRLRAWRLRARVESSQLDAVGRGLEGLKTVGERLLEGGQSLCVVIDEYDLLFEGEDGPSGSIWESLAWYMRDVAALAVPSREAV